MKARVIILNNFMKSFFTAAIAGAICANADPLYSQIKSSVMNLNKMNYDKQVGKNREKGISVVQFYNSEEENSKKSKG